MSLKKNLPQSPMETMLKLPLLITSTSSRNPFYKIIHSYIAHDNKKIRDNLNTY